MKNAAALLLVFIFCFAGLTRADDTKYTEAMKKNISQMDSLRSINDMIDLTNSFLRIADAEKGKWLPYYYASYLFVITSYSDTTKLKKDSYLDEAMKAIGIADSLQPNESEIYTLKGMISQARLQVDPMNRYMQYGQQMNESFEKAKMLEPNNPRPEYLMGMTTYYTPEQFGGGAKAAKPMFESALKKFNEFVPKDELMPKWGKGQLENFMRQIPQ
jgi:hypothetical protein